MEKARAYDNWSPIHKRMYNPDGSMKEEYRAELMASGTTLFDTFYMESRKMKEVKDFEEREKNFQKNWGISYTEWEQSGRENLTPAQREKRQQQALDSGEELSSLPYHMEPDEYYDYYADYPC
jgi:hypothetical protein